MEAASTSSWQKPPVGTYPARVSRIVDIGRQHGSYLDKATIQSKLLITFELTGPRRTDGRPFEIQATVAKSTHDNSHLVRWIDAALGHHNIDDLAVLLNKPVLLNIIHSMSRTSGNENAYVDSKSVRMLPDGMTADPLEVEPTIVLHGSPIQIERIIKWADPSYPRE